VTCRELSEFIGDYLSGDLAPEQRTWFEDHLQICDNCRRYLTHYQRVIELGRGAFSDPDALVPDEVPEDLVRAILSARQRH
jgi:anti-sigma factor RsiW